MPAKFQSWVYRNIWEPSNLRAGDNSNVSIGGRFWEFIQGELGLDRVSVSQAQRLSAVYTALNVRSQTIASLPIAVYQSNGQDVKKLENHPVYYPLAFEPNNYMSSANMFLTSMINADAEGNAYIYIHRNGRYQPKSFELWCATEVSPVIVEGEAFYKYEGRVYPARDVIHFRWFSQNGFLGLSAIRMNANTMAMAAKQDKYSGMSLGSKPPGILSYEGNLTPTQMEQNKESWTKDLAAGRTPVLSGNWKFQPIMISPGDAEYINSRKLTRQEIFGIFRIPPVFAQDYERATFTNAEQSDLIFTKHTILPIVRVIEQELRMKLFTEAEKPNTFVKFNVNGLLRGDLKARAEFYTAMRNVGGMDGNEMRALEDMNSYPGGDIKTIQSANIPVDQLRTFYENKVAPTADPNKTEPAKGKKGVDAYETA